MNNPLHDFVQNALIRLYKDRSDPLYAEELPFIMGKIEAYQEMLREIKRSPISENKTANYTKYLK